MSLFIAKPSARLSPFVELYWSLEIGQREKREESELVVPTGMSQLIFHYGRPFSRELGGGKCSQKHLILCGPEDKGSFVSAEAGCGMIGVLFKPYGLRPFLRMPVSELATLELPLSELMGPSAREFEERLSICSHFQERIAAMERLLLKQFSPGCRFSWTMAREGALRIKASPADLTLSSLSASLNISQRTMERLFLSHIGVTPKFFSRICRFHQAMDHLKKGGQEDLARLALDCGYYDQSHLCLEIKRFTGLTPRALQKR